MENNGKNQNIVKKIYGDDFEKTLTEDEKQKKRRLDNKKKLVQKSRITVVFSITVLILSIYCLLNLNQGTAEYVVCVFVIILNLLLVSSVIFLGMSKKNKDLH